MRFSPQLKLPETATQAFPLQIRMLGALTIIRGGAPIALPGSRKVRALLAYLAMSPGPVARSPLCELLWDVPNDPRGELRWSLSKIRGVFEGDDHRRVHTHEDRVGLDVSDCFVDAIEVLRVAEQGFGSLELPRLRALADLFYGDFLEGLEIERSAVFNGWLIAQRRRYRGCHAALLEHIVKRVPAEEALSVLDKWMALAPFDPQVHFTLLNTLARGGRIREGEEHVAATAKLFDDEGLDSMPIRQAWRDARGASAPLIQSVGAPAALSQSAGEPVAPARSRGSIAVMPFIDQSTVILQRGSVADALAHDVITRLAKLRSLFVIAQGTVFALHERGIGAEEAGRTLNVDYVVSGTVRTQGRRMMVGVELVETRSARIIWAEIFNQKQDGAFAILDEIGDRIVASIASEIETLERNRAILKPPNSLDAWEAHHRGLWHMHQYRQADNEKARQFFEVALRLDPTFSRAHAGLSFTHFQDVFQNWAPRAAAIESAYETASKGLMADERDPAVHWAMGRALWLRQSHEESLSALTRSIELSPNFALGHYNLSFVHSIVGDANAAIERSDYSRRLSPFDPMLFAMYGSRAMALARLGRFDEAAQWAVKAAGRPNAFPHIHVIAACCLALAGSVEQGRVCAATARRLVPAYRIADFFSAFPFEPAGQAVFRKGAALVGLT